MSRSRHTWQNEQGFTLLEVVLAILLTGMLSFGVWKLAETMGRAQLASWRQGDAHNTIVSIDYSLRTHTENVGSGMISTANYGPLNVRRALVGAVAFDTLYSFKADTATIRNASRPCQSGSTNCIVLVGDHSDRFALGDLVVTGSPATGARVLQLTANPSVRNDVCGADCLDVVACSFQDDSDMGSAPRGSYTYTAGASINGGATTPGQTCSQPYTSSGGSCIEDWDARTFERQYPFCSASPSTTSFTEMQVVDRTAQFGYPLGPTSVLMSATATPKVRTQKVEPRRFFVQNAGSPEAFLVQQVGLNNDGTWAKTIPIAGPITRFQIETLHEEDATWTQGVGVTEAMLSLTSSNRVTTLTPSPSAPAGYAYIKSYASVALLRVTYELPHVRNDGSPDPILHSVLINATPTLNGGSDGG